jgi:hypothetical protein
MHIIANVLPIGSVNVCDNQEFHSTIHVELQKCKVYFKARVGLLPEIRGLGQDGSCILEMP